MAQKKIRAGKPSLPSNDAIMRHWRSFIENSDRISKDRFDGDILALLKASRLTRSRVNGLLHRLHPSDLEGFLSSIEERASRAEVSRSEGEVRLFVIPVSGSDEAIGKIESDLPFDEINEALKKSGYLGRGRIALFDKTLSIPDFACASASQIFELANSATRFIEGAEEMHGVRKKLEDIASDGSGGNDLATRALVGGYRPEWEPLTGRSDGLEVATRSPNDGDDISRLQACHHQWKGEVASLEERLGLKLGQPVAWHEARIYLLIGALDETLGRSIRENDLEVPLSDIELEVGMVKDAIVIDGYLGEEVIYNLEFHAGFVMPVLSSFMRILGGRYHVRKWSEAT
jgi:hypothetical protein